MKMQSPDNSYDEDFDKADMGLSEHESPRGHIGDTPKVGPAGWNL